MTSPTLKDVLIEALNQEFETVCLYPETHAPTKNCKCRTRVKLVNQEIPLDHFAKALTDHLFDRERVRAALITACGFTYSPGFSDEDGLGCPAEFSLNGSRDLPAEAVIDLLIEGLTGKGDRSALP